MAARHAYFVRLGFFWRRCATFTPGYPCTLACRKRTALQPLAGGRIVTEHAAANHPLCVPALPAGLWKDHGSPGELLYICPGLPQLVQQRLV